MMLDELAAKIGMISKAYGIRVSRIAKGADTPDEALWEVEVMLDDDDRGGLVSGCVTLPEACDKAWKLIGC